MKEKEIINQIENLIEKIKTEKNLSIKKLTASQISFLALKLKRSN